MGDGAAEGARRGWTALAHVAKRELGLAEAEYRALLHGAAGVWSAAELSSERQFDAVMEAFERFGFRRRPSPPPRARRAAWGCTARQQAKVEAMWASVARTPTDKALRAFVRRVAKVDAPEFLDAAGARKVILALEAMSRQAAASRVSEGG